MVQPSRCVASNGTPPLGCTLQKARTRSIAQTITLRFIVYARLLWVCSWI